MVRGISASVEPSVTLAQDKQALYEKQAEGDKLANFIIDQCEPGTLEEFLALRGTGLSAEEAIAELGLNFEDFEEPDVSEPALDTEDKQADTGRTTRARSASVPSKKSAGKKKATPQAQVEESSPRVQPTASTSKTSGIKRIRVVSTSSEGNERGVPKPRVESETGEAESVSVTRDIPAPTLGRPAQPVLSKVLARPTAATRFSTPPTSALSLASVFQLSPPSKKASNEILSRSKRILLKLRPSVLTRSSSLLRPPRALSLVCLVPLSRPSPSIKLLLKTRDLHSRPRSVSPLALLLGTQSAQPTSQVLLLLRCSLETRLLLTLWGMSDTIPTG
ncbi:unnamed protein product [Tilletia caries]|nr:unnamed protein product [Tilletia caries]CAD6935560.1 unnamed protein product [Tilletia controversa]